MLHTKCMWEPGDITNDMWTAYLSSLNLKKNVSWAADWGRIRNRVIYGV